MNQSRIIIIIIGLVRLLAIVLTEQVGRYDGCRVMVTRAIYRSKLHTLGSSELLKSTLLLLLCHLGILVVVFVACQELLFVMHAQRHT